VVRLLLGRVSAAAVSAAVAIEPIHNTFGYHEGTDNGATKQQTANQRQYKSGREIFTLSWSKTSGWGGGDGWGGATSFGQLCVYAHNNNKTINNTAINQPSTINHQPSTTTNVSHKQIPPGGQTAATTTTPATAASGTYLDPFHDGTHTGTNIDRHRHRGRNVGEGNVSRCFRLFHKRRARRPFASGRQSTAAFGVQSNVLERQEINGGGWIRTQTAYNC